MAMGVSTKGLALAVALVAASGPLGASDYELLNVGLMARVGEKTVFGAQSPNSFQEYALRASWRTPWSHALSPALSISARLLGGVGVFEGSSRTAAVASMIPALALGTSDRRFTLDGGAGLAVLSAHRYGEQDFGGPVQVALTLGLEGPLYRRVGLAYRFMHYSDAGAYGPHTVGADLHMAGVTYRF
jgi:hypothetical protein